MKYDINETAILNLTVAPQNISHKKYVEHLQMYEAEDQELSDAIETIIVKLNSHPEDIKKISSDRLNYYIRTFPQYDTTGNIYEEKIN